MSIAADKITIEDPVDTGPETLAAMYRDTIGIELDLGSVLIDPSKFDWTSSPIPPSEHTIEAVRRYVEGLDDLLATSYDGFVPTVVETIPLPLARFIAENALLIGGMISDARAYAIAIRNPHVIEALDRFDGWHALRHEIIELNRFGLSEHRSHPNQESIRIAGLADGKSPMEHASWRNEGISFVQRPESIQR